MTIRTLRLFGSLGLLVTLACQVPTRRADTLTFLDSARPNVLSLKEDVVWLAADERQGRRAGTSGEKAAAEYIARRFERLGLEPAGENGTYFQEFEVSLPARDGGGSSLVVHQEGGPLLVDAQEAIVPLFCSEGGPVTGTAWFCGYGIVNEMMGWDDYGGQDLAGGIAFIVRGTPPDDVIGKHPEAMEEEGVTKGHGWGNSGSIFHKVMTAKRHGAAGVVLVQHPEDSSEPLLRFDASQTGRAGIPCAMITSDTMSLMAGNYVGYLDLSDSVGDRQAHYDESDPIKLVVNISAHVIAQVGLQPYLVVEGVKPNSSPITVELRADVVRESAPARNVLARRTGALPDRTVVIGAHYDHLGHGGEGSLAPNEYGEIHNGADDNASGTACVLELARLLSGEWIPDGDVVFALWSGEELGLLGSEHFMRNPTFDLAEMHANINLDMVGRCDDGELTVLGAGTSPRFEGWMAGAGVYADLKLGVSLSPRGDGGSDHQSFLRREIPALHLFSGTHPDYHKPSDDAEKVEIDGMRRVVLLCLEFVTRMHQESELAFTEVDEEAQEPIHRRSSGARFGSVPSYAPDDRGLVLEGTSPRGPAEAAGLLGGDILTQVGAIGIGTIHDFVYALQAYKPGDVVKVRFLRDGEEQETRVTLTSNQIE